MSGKKLYLPKEIPEVVTVPKQTFFMLNGKGDPNGDAFTEKINVLYSLSYAVRMMPKQGYTPEGYVDYTVYPLEGLWDLTEEGKKSGTMSKDEFLYTVMIRQPGFVTRDVADRAFETVRKKKPIPCWTRWCSTRLKMACPCRCFISVHTIASRTASGS